MNVLEKHLLGCWLWDCFKFTLMTVGFFKLIEDLSRLAFFLYKKASAKRPSDQKLI